MIQTNELRVGNSFEYLTEEGWLPTIIDIGDITMCFVDNEYFNDNYRPVDLTEEILLKYGFEIKHYPMHRGYWATISMFDNGLYEKTLIINHSDAGTNLYINDARVSFITNKITSDSIKIFDSKDNIFLHELQNVFFEFTRTELKLKQ